MIFKSEVFCLSNSSVTHESLDTVEHREISSNLRYFLIVTWFLPICRTCQGSERAKTVSCTFEYAINLVFVISNILSVIGSLIAVQSI